MGTNNFVCEDGKLDKLLFKEIKGYAPFNKKRLALYKILCDSSDYQISTERHSFLKLFIPLYKCLIF